MQAQALLKHSSERHKESKSSGLVEFPAEFKDDHAKVRSQEQGLDTRRAKTEKYTRKLPSSSRAIKQRIQSTSDMPHEKGEGEEATSMEQNSQVPTTQRKRQVCALAVESVWSFACPC